MKNLLLLIFSLFATAVIAQENSWEILETTNVASPRHENSFVECDGKFYALGGRTDRPVEEFDPKTKTWKTLADVPMNFHHFQAISYNHEIYVIGAFTGGYPHETPIPNFLIFNPKKNEWREGPEIPKDRLRGSVGVFTRNDKIYLASGIIDGHWDGHVTWFDEYNPKTGKWTILPDAPRARDHFGATLIDDKAYLVGGRRSSAVIGKVLDLTVAEVDYFDFETNTWHTIDSTIPTERAGTSNVAIGPNLIVMNGESVAQESAHAEVEMLDTRTGTWTSLPKLNQGRHGTGVVYYKGKIYVAAGSANRGGGPELNNIEVLEWK